MASQPPTTQPKIKLYWLDDSRAQRFVWLLEELGVDYEIVMFKRTEARLAPPELKKIHPLGKAPVVGITLPDPADPTKQKEVVLAESGYIAQLLSEHFGQNTSLLPKRYRDGLEGQLGAETEEWTRCQYLLYYAEGSFMPLLLITIVLDILTSPNIPFFLRPVTKLIVGQLYSAFVSPELANHLSFLESQLETSPGNGDYLCGTQLTAGDILMIFPLVLARTKAGELSAGKGQGKLADKYPKLWAYLKRLEESPGYKRAEVKIAELEKGKKEAK